MHGARRRARAARRAGPARAPRRAPGGRGRGAVSSIFNFLDVALSRFSLNTYPTELNTFTCIEQVVLRELVVLRFG